MNPDIDNASGLPDNEGNNGTDDKNVVIRLDEIAPLYDVDCDHSFVRDKESLGDYKAWKCNKCHRGTFLHKSITKIT